jgi:hypothetical protein
LMTFDGLANGEGSNEHPRKLVRDPLGRARVAGWSHRVMGDDLHTTSRPAGPSRPGAARGV